jgi:hypothetical protein
LNGKFYAELAGTVPMKVCRALPQRKSRLFKQMLRQAVRRWKFPTFAAPKKPYYKGTPPALEEFASHIGEYACRPVIRGEISQWTHRSHGTRTASAISSGARLRCIRYLP